MTLDLVAAVAAGYFLGGIPTALWIARLLGRNIFEVGSGNMGSMNTARNIGPVAGVVVFVVDVGKGSLAVLLGMWMAGVTGWSDPLFPALAGGVGAVAGHAWSPYAKFRGGKGLASVLGAALPIAPLGGVAALALLAVLVLVSKRSEASAIAALAAYPFLVGWMATRRGYSQDEVFLIGTGMALVAAVSVVKHVQVGRQRRRAVTEPRADGAGGPHEP